tara:strand:+ start:8487 stop:9251 length:765 start_codon:yes stop_codon:yes gene_type:complete
MEEEDRHASIVAALQGEEVESDEEYEEYEDSDSQSVEEDSDASDELEEETEVYADDDDDDDTEVEEGHRVPYDRFKRINDRRHVLQSELEQRESTIAELQEQLSKKRAPQERSQDLEENDFSVFEEDEPDDITYLKQQTQEMQVKFATMELEHEVGVATRTYPNVPEEYIWDSLAQNGNQNASEVAARYSSWVAGVEEAAIARYLEEDTAVETGASAPPRPSRKQSARSQSSKEGWKPSTTDEARDAMVAYLKG